jgi:hypothetical protein
MTNRSMTILYLVPIVFLPVLFACGAYLLLTSTPSAEVPLRALEPAYTRSR